MVMENGMENGMVERTLSRFERIALAEAFVSNSEVTKSVRDLESLIEETIGSGDASQRIFKESSTLYKNYNSAEIICNGWKTITNDLIPRFTSNGLSDEYGGFNFEFLCENEASFWKPCIVLLSLWKFVYSRRGNRGIEKYSSKLSNYEEISEVIKKIVYQGTKWLDDKVLGQYDGCIPPFYDDDRKDLNKPCAVQEQSMYLFARSHLSHSEISGDVTEINKKLITPLIESRKDAGWAWPDISDLEGKTEREGSIRATCLAMTALSDLFDYDKLNADFKREVDRIGRETLVHIANSQIFNGAWPQYVTSTKGDVPATSYALYCLDRFNEMYDVKIPNQIFYDSQVWLSNEITGIINKKGNLEISDTEIIARAMPALSRSCPYLSVIWYRKAFESLFERGNVTSQDFSMQKAWNLYATTEMIRRPSIAAYLERII
jgi:hypothetical protein